MRVYLSSLIAAAVLIGVSSARAQDQPQVPKEVLKELSYLVGTWKSEGRTGQEKFEGTWSAKWTPGKYCLIMQMSFSPLGNTEKTMAAGVIGWDPVKKRITEHSFWSNNECYTLLWDTKPSGDWEGELKGVENGKEFTAAIKVAKKGSDQFVYTSKNAVGDEIEVVFTKVPAQKGKKAKKDAQ